MIFFFCFIDRFVSCLPCQSSIEAYSTVSCGNQMDNGVISVISNLNGGDTKVIQQSLPLSFTNVGLSIHKSSIDKDDDITV